MVADGRVRYAGFSFHDDKKIFREIVDDYDWALCQIQYNYYDENFQAGREGLEYAAEKGLGVVIMEPLRGGKLTEKIPGVVQAIWDSARSRRSPAEWALRWIWNHPGVSTVLSGMSTLSQTVENIAVADEAAPYSLSNEELEVIRGVSEAYQALQQINCTYCSYCMPCPQGVNIPLNFSLYNDTFFFKDPEVNYMLYNRMLPPEQRADNCNECGECEEACTQQIKIIQEMKKVHRKLAK
jgi:predicted aldo/keto reductase-like oxidoreductase